MSPDATSPTTTLAEHLRLGPLTADKAAQLLWALCRSIEATTPDTPLEVSPEMVLLEGGLDAMAPRLSRGTRATDGFTAPERASSGPTSRSAVYSLGALLYSSLTGRPPDGGPVPESAGTLRGVLDRCLAADPSQRYPDVAALRQALSRLDRTHVSGGAAPAPLQLTQTQAQTLGHWGLEKLIGEGSMGQIFLGRHTLLGRTAAIKLLRPEQYKNPELVQRFFQEARTVNQINHEHIVEILDFVTEGGADGPSAVYFVMELLQGRSVDAELARGPITLKRTLDICEQVADALAAAHRVGVVHRDVKPENVMLITRGDRPDYVKVLDFGVAKLTQGDETSMVSTMDGAIIGTPICMSPEQAQGANVDARTDIWALGVILYRMLSGQLPFEAQNFTALALKIITAAPAPLPAKTPSGDAIPRALAQLVERCLAKDRELRPARMEEVRDTLRSLRLGEVPVVSPASRKRSSRWPLLAGLAMAALTGIGGTMAWNHYAEAEAPPDDAVTAAGATQPRSPADAPQPAQPPEPTQPPEPAQPPEPTQPPEPDQPPAKAKQSKAPPDAPERPKAPRPKPVPLTKELVGAEFPAMSSRFSSCMASAGAGTTFKGAVVVSFSVASSGKLSKVQLLTREVENLPEGRCAVEAVKRHHFPPVTGARPTRVSFQLGADQ